MSADPHDDGRRRQRPAEPLPAALVALLGPRLPARPACAGAAPMFDDFVGDESANEREQRIAQALQLCARCPALPACRDAAVDLGEDARGVWAGELHVVLTRTERRRQRDGAA